MNKIILNWVHVRVSLIRSFIWLISPGAFRLAPGGWRLAGGDPKFRLIQVEISGYFFIMRNFASFFRRNFGSPHASRHSPVATRRSPLASRQSQVATRKSPGATRQAPPARRNFEFYLIRPGLLQMTGCIYLDLEAIFNDPDFVQTRICRFSH